MNPMSFFVTPDDVRHAISDAVAEIIGNKIREAFAAQGVARAVSDTWREIAAAAPLAWVAWNDLYLDDHGWNDAPAHEPCPEDVWSIACAFGVEVCGDCAAEHMADCDEHEDIPR